MTVTLRQPLTLEECQQIRIWRNATDVFPMLRTGYKSPADQARFYHTHVAPRFWRRTFWAPDHRYYAVEVDGKLAGVSGLTYLRKRQGEAEISLVLGPWYRGKGIGSQVVDLVLAEAWRLGLTSVTGECYKSGAMAFWTKQVSQSARWPVEFHWDHAGSLHWRWVKRA